MVILIMNHDWWQPYRAKWHWEKKEMRDLFWVWPLNAHSTSSCLHDNSNDRLRWMTKGRTHCSINISSLICSPFDRRLICKVCPVSKEWREKTLAESFPLQLLLCRLWCLRECSAIVRDGKSGSCTRFCVECACSMRKVQGSTPGGSTK